MQSEASKKAVKKYLAKFDEIKIRVPKGKRDAYKALADAENVSLNQLIVNLLEEELKKHPDILLSQDDKNDITTA